MAKLLVQLAAEPDLQPVRGGPLRTDVQGARPEFVLASRLGEKLHLL